MEQLLQWAWDRCAPRYSWAVFVIAVVALLPQYLLVAFLVVAYEDSDRYVEAATVAFVAVLVQMGLIILCGRMVRLAERWADGDDVDSAQALAETYTRTRAIFPRAVAIGLVVHGSTTAAVAAIAGASGPRIIQYGIMGAALGAGVMLGSFHGFTEGAMRPVRVALAADTTIGDALPRLRPSFVTWSNVFVLLAAFNFSVASAMVATVFASAVAGPVLAVVIGLTMMLVFGLPIAVVANFSQSLGPVRDLAEGTKRVAVGDYSQRLPVVQDDDLGALAASFNQMQAGLAERERLHSAFGSYVDPALAERLLAQGDDLFQGQEVNVTVFFADIRNFTSYAEHATASDAVARLNALWDVIVPILRDHHGHANKFLGDGVLAVFGVPEEINDHADHAVAAAIEIQQRVRETFGPDLRIGIGINTGNVIAGTIGGGGKLEFTLIGDPVNVAARVEQLTKETGDSMLLTQATVDSLNSRPFEIQDRGHHVVRGRDATVNMYAVNA